MEESKNYSPVLEEIDRVCKRIGWDRVFLGNTLDLDCILDEYIGKENLSKEECRIILEYANMANSSVKPFNKEMENFKMSKAVKMVMAYFLSGGLAIIGSYLLIKTGAEFADINLAELVGADTSIFRSNDVAKGFAGLIGVGASLVGGWVELEGEYLTRFTGVERPDYDKLTGLSKFRENTLKRLEDL